MSASRPAGFRYRLYGLSVASNLALPHLIPSTGPGESELAIEFHGPTALRPLPADRETVQESAGVAPNGEPFFLIWRCRQSSDIYLGAQYTDGTAHVRFSIDRAGTRIGVRWTAPIQFGDVLSYLLGPVVGCAVCLRGLTPIHAGAVAVGNRAAAFVGPKGAGKSTLLAAMASEGHRVLADDLVPVSRRQGRRWVYPGYARLRVWPPTAEAFSALGDESLQPVLSVSDKRYLDLDPDEGAGGSTFETKALPLAAIFFLGERRAAGDHVISALKPQTSLLELLRNCYSAYLLEPEDRGRDFERLRRVVLEVPCWEIKSVNDLSGLSSLCDTVIDCMERLPPPPLR